MTKICTTLMNKSIGLGCKFLYICLPVARSETLVYQLNSSEYENISKYKNR